ncbi:MAG: glycosyltransferase family protein [Candidatus Thermoplasmatota archaeon]|nr:glycosyltransferase family protein [Candidatus Thermoplasmatota archaeon]
MKIVGIIEARMGSSRLPGKVLLPLGDKPVLERLIERVSRSRYLNTIIVATTEKDADQPIVGLCERIGVSCFRGSEDDVLDRVLKAAKSVDADIICELMGDSPLLDPILIDNTITAHLAGGYDYTSNFFPENTFPMGFAVQVFPVSVLEKAAKLTQNPIDRVHVSCFIYHNPKLFTLQGVCANLHTYAPDLRLSLDTGSDYEIICKVFNALYKENTCFLAQDVVAYLRTHPELCFINKDVRQKTVDEG